MNRMNKNEASALEKNRNKNILEHKYETKAYLA